MTESRFGVYEWNGIEVIDMSLPQNDGGVKMIPQAMFKKFYSIVVALIEEKLEYFIQLSEEERRKISQIVISHMASFPVIKSANSALEGT